MDGFVKRGLIESIETRNEGSFLQNAVSAGATVLTPQDVDPFLTETLAGQVRINGVDYAYSAASAANSTITISPGAASDLDEGEPILAFPIAPVTWATVSFDGGEGLPVRIAAAHKLLLPTGPREGDAREVVTVYREGPTYVTLDVQNIDVQVAPEAAVNISGGGVDGGNIDDTFTPPVLAEYVFNGDPDYWLNIWGTDTTLYTESEAFDHFDAPRFLYAYFDAGTLQYDFEWIGDTSTYPPGYGLLIPVWSLPLIGQNAAIVIDSAGITGMSADPINDSGTQSLDFGTIIETPTSRHFSTTGSDGFSIADSFAFGPSRRSWWSVSPYVEPMPATSASRTLPPYGLSSRGAVRMVPQTSSSAGDPGLTTGATLTGVRMVQT